MKIQYIHTSKTETVCDSYGARLIEQGKAVLVTEAKKPARKPGEKAAAADGA